MSLILKHVNKLELCQEERVVQVYHVSGYGRNSPMFYQRGSARYEQTNRIHHQTT